jgi:tetratricopeptide (TPR) repeat protein
VSSLKQAMQLAPDSARYLLDLGYFYHAQRDLPSRATAMAYFEEAVRVARGNGPPDRHVLSTALIETGRNRHIDAPGTGEAQRLLADTAFAEAWRVAPDDPRAFYYFAMSLAARAAWKELAALAQEKLEWTPAHPWSSLILGLALQRQRLTHEAREAFAQGLNGLPPAERSLVFSMERILRPSEAEEYRRAGSAHRALMERVAWLRDDPLWSRDDDDPQVEFYARVVYAELAWSTPERGDDGPSTMRGNNLIRYGALPGAGGRGVVPFDPVPGGFAWEMDPSRAEGGDLFERMRAEFGLPDAARIRPEQRGGVNPPRAPTDLGVARMVIAGPQLHARMEPGEAMLLTAAELARARAERTPARWTNALLARIDSMPVQVVRFRGGTDSVDLYIAAEAPVERIRAASAVNTRARGDFWLYGLDIMDGFRDSVDLFGIGALRWVKRAPPGRYLYRLEATADGVLRAARATAVINLSPDSTDGFTTRGFGLSDLWFASDATPRGTPRSWRDFQVAPVLAPLDSGGNVSLIWETYGTIADGDVARYDVTIAMHPVDTGTTGARRIAARIAAGVAAALGASRDEDELGVTFNFARETRHAPVLVDHVTIELGATPPGAYLVTLAVRDLVGDRTITRSARLSIAAPRESGR